MLRREAASHVSALYEVEQGEGNRRVFCKCSLRDALGTVHGAFFYRPGPAVIGAWVA
jgi:hypothetical protein